MKFVQINHHQNLDGAAASYSEKVSRSRLLHFNTRNCNTAYLFCILISFVVYLKTTLKQNKNPQTPAIFITAIVFHRIQNIAL